MPRLYFSWTGTGWARGATGTYHYCTTGRDRLLCGRPGHWNGHGALLIANPRRACRQCARRLNAICRQLVENGRRDNEQKARARPKADS